MRHRAIYEADDGRVYNQEEFAKVYNEFDDLNELADAVNMTKPRISVIACRLRKRGFDIKTYKR